MVENGARSLWVTEFVEYVTTERIGLVVGVNAGVKSTEGNALRCVASRVLVGR